ncbi:MAG: flagellar hook-basal body complex protein FliE [Candidatus Latescibacterota bacterium]|nr:flagellar hook-basal body complex protein FliE [Candidatus Latescibacterota bacterium]
MDVQAVRDFTGRGESGTSTLRIQPQAELTGGIRAGDEQQRQSFSELVKDFAGDVNRLQFRSGHAIDELVTGEAADVHQVMVAVEEAGIALDLMLEIRNRVLEGYQELIRMQV